MSRALLLVVAAVFAVPGVTQAEEPKYVKVTGVVGGSQLVVKAFNQGGNFVGLGTLTAPTGQVYNLKVLSGTVQQNRYVSLQGTILAPNGSPATSFILNGDQTTGGILFRYTGASGTSITQTTKGSVIFYY